MTEETFSQLATLDALELLSADEAACYRRLLARAGADVAEADADRDVAAMLALAIEPVAPPAEAKRQILDTIRRRGELDESLPQKSRTIRAGEGRWYRQPVEGLEVMPLSVDKERGIATIMMRLAPGTILPAHDHQGAEESYVVSGSCRIGSVALNRGDFHHVDAGQHHGTVVSDEGCTLLLVVDVNDYLAA
jgi:anti-sigma factor ChrR (cupin superfamily)